MSKAAKRQKKICDSGENDPLSTICEAVTNSQTNSDVQFTPFLFTQNNLFWTKELWKWPANKACRTQLSKPNLLTSINDGSDVIQPASYSFYGRVRIESWTPTDSESGIWKKPGF